MGLCGPVQGGVWLPRDSASLTRPLVEGRDRLTMVVVVVVGWW